MLVRGKEGMYTEAAYAAYRQGHAGAFMRGDRAFELKGRETPGVQLRRCMLRGIPEDEELTAMWARRLLGVSEKRVPGQKTALLAVSPLISGGSAVRLMKALVNEEIDRAGMVPADFAAALGAGKDITEGTARFMLDVGDSQITFSVFAGGLHIRCRALPFGMDRGEEYIIERVRLETGLIIGWQTARELKHRAFDTLDGNEFECPALDVLTRRPALKKIPQQPVMDALCEITGEILRFCKAETNFLSPGCARDFKAGGITLTGGGARIKGLDRLLSEKLEVPVAVCPEPELAVARGLKEILENQYKYAPAVTDWRERGQE